MATSESEVRTLIDELEGSGLDPQLRARVVASLRELHGEAELGQVMLEVRDEELAAVRGLLSSISYPIIEVSLETLCVPIVGPVDADIMTGVTETILRAASERRARWVIVDLTGAQLGDVVAADALGRLFRALMLIGVGGTISGVSPSLAQTLASADMALGVAVYRSLAAALAATRDERPAR